MATFLVFLLAGGASLPDAARGAGLEKWVAGSKVSFDLKSQSASKKTNKKKQPAKKKNAKKTKSSKKSQASRKLDELANLPWPENVSQLAGNGGVIVMDNYASREGPQELFSLNPDTMYVPASILKLVTAAAALEILGPSYQFKTDFALDDSGGLWVAGHGDPALVSEELCSAMDKLAQLGLKRVGNIYLDTSYFEPGLVLDGNTFTSNPYDAYNGALGVNFNTVTYLIDKAGRVVEFDKCSPLTTVTIELAKKNKPQNKRARAGSYRVNISESPALAEEHAGLMIRALLESRGVEVTGGVILGQAMPDDVTPLYTHVNSRNLEQTLAELLEFSNNYMTNQIFLIMGAEAFGAPATMDKGRQAVLGYLSRRGLSELTMVEGSGLSRNNQVTARQMSEILGVFEPNLHLAKATSDGSVFYKTGTMTDIQTLAGYLVRPDRPNEPLWFVILLNGSYSPGTREKILAVLKAHFVDEPLAKTAGG
jgi:D-alanyl-D-alanine carboxypeptidase/D-alanyl-D-alanine-endopeptidase (penicillin-binding protein 4)